MLIEGISLDGLHLHWGHLPCAVALLALRLNTGILFFYGLGWRLAKVFVIHLPTQLYQAGFQQTLEGLPWAFTLGEFTSATV